MFFFLVFEKKKLENHLLKASNVQIINDTKCEFGLLTL